MHREQMSNVEVWLQIKRIELIEQRIKYLQTGRRQFPLFLLAFILSFRPSQKHKVSHIIGIRVYSRRSLSSRSLTERLWNNCGIQQILQQPAKRNGRRIHRIISIFLTFNDIQLHSLRNWLVFLSPSVQNLVLLQTLPHFIRNIGGLHTERSQARYSMAGHLGRHRTLQQVEQQRNNARRPMLIIDLLLYLGDARQCLQHLQHRRHDLHFLVGHTRSFFPHRHGLRVIE
mmetsp:Transcript_52557/g.83696  ORF Transcript_52557/g.83696 Transcript_52557/m.83696 type:complete len:229 (-) Transcript_52557:1809-2495(-)